MSFHIFCITQNMSRWSWVGRTHPARGYNGEVKRTTPTDAFLTPDICQSSLLVKGTSSIQIRGPVIPELANGNLLGSLSLPSTQALDFMVSKTTRLEKAMAPHSSTPAWKIPWMEESGGLQSMGSLRVGHDWATSLSLFTFMYWRRKWRPTPVFLLENPRDGGARWAAVYGVTQSRTRLKRLSSSSSKTTWRHFP